MTFVVPFDGTELAEAALVRATEFGALFEEDVLAVSVIPRGNTDYARDRGWIEANETFEMDAAVSTLHTQVTDLCPSADFRHVVVDRFAPSGTISKRIRETARKENASMVFVGSENAGHMVTSVSSVGGNVATDDGYDVTIVRHPRPARIAKHADAVPERRPKSHFYLPE
ncbi:universal stress protein [Salinigranum rubrum]|uniref:Universal stress protein n=1 Tax=Salinigranum rubrum TaxID=755307 RepID=A0A2I8VKF7_9EURY|nr:universal stress protein [Salinigranum rubrum]AUV82408.1 universal stress protein [Salinigranum rubrum]